MRRRGSGTMVFEGDFDLPMLARDTQDPLRYFGPFLYWAAQLRSGATVEGAPDEVPQRLARMLRRTRDVATTAFGSQISEDCIYLVSVLLDNSGMTRRDSLGSAWREYPLELALCRSSTYGRDLPERIAQIIESGDRRVLRLLVAALSCGLDLAIDPHERERVVQLAAQAHGSEPAGAASVHPGPRAERRRRAPLIGPLPLVGVIVGAVTLAGMFALGAHTRLLLMSAAAHMPGMETSR